MTGAETLLLAAACAALLLGAAGLQLWDRRYGARARLRRRLDRIGGGPAPDAGEAEAGRRRREVKARLKEMERRRADRSWRERLARAIVQAGWSLSVGGLLAAAAAAAFAAMAGLLAAGFPPPVALCGGVAAGAGLPHLALRAAIRRRQAKFTGHFVEALDVIVRGVRSGLPVMEGLRTVGREVPDPVGEEFRNLTESLRLGMPLAEALDRAAERMPTAELQFFAIALTVQQQSGGNLAEILANLAGVLRGRRRLIDKIAALSAEAKASAAIIGSLPFVVAGALAVLNPDYIALLVQTDLGRLLAAAAGVSMAVGILVMRAMIRFDI
ncbi:MAG TPA: type II secretion system F family protein [Alphaproteobacteria bacterium]|nr:type II secretion system F family protein [Alphaproteobacteria bacterium]